MSFLSPFSNETKGYETVLYFSFLMTSIIAKYFQKNDGCPNERNIRTFFLLAYTIDYGSRSADAHLLQSIIEGKEKEE